MGHTGAFFSITQPCKQACYCPLDFKPLHLKWSDVSQQAEEDEQRSAECGAGFYFGGGWQSARSQGEIVWEVESLLVGKLQRCALQGSELFPAAWEHCR